MPKYEFKKERMTPQVRLKTCWDGSRVPENFPCPQIPRRKDSKHIKRDRMDSLQDRMNRLRDIRNRKNLKF